jgi:hypothetical protein
MPGTDSLSLGAKLLRLGLLGLAILACLAAAHFVLGMPMYPRGRGGWAAGDAAPLGDAEIASALLIIAGVFGAFAAAGGLLLLLKGGRRA